MRKKLLKISALAAVGFGAWLAVKARVQLEPGQVWTYQTGNPFGSKIETNTIVAIKSGWVQYDSVKPAFGGGMMTNRCAQSIGWFLAGSTRIK